MPSLRKSSAAFVGLMMLLGVLGAANNAHAAAESDLVVGYSSGQAARAGSEDALQAAVLAQVGSANDAAARSGSPHRQRVAGFIQSADNCDGLTSTGGMVGWLSANNGHVADVRAYADGLGADLVTYIFQNGDSVAGVAEQPGRYSAYNNQVYWTYFAHESGGHNFGGNHGDAVISPMTVMGNNYCGGGGANGYYTNPNIWQNGVKLLGTGNCTGGTIYGGDDAYMLSNAAQGKADSWERLIYGSNLYPIVKRWQFNKPAGAAPAGTIIDDDIGGADAIVRGQGATFTGTGLRLPGGTTGNTAANSIAAYIDLPNGMFSSMPSFTIEIWATPIVGSNWMRVIDIGRTVEAGDGLGVAGEYTGTPGSAAPGATTASDAIELSAANNSTSLNNQRLIAGLDGTIQTADSTLGTTAGQQHHYAITFEDTTTGGTVSWYRDGAFVKSIKVTFHAAALEDVNNWLGRSLWSGDTMANIEYQDVRIQSVALKAGQVAANYLIGPHDAVSTLYANDAYNSSGFTTGSWEFGNVPSAARDYETGVMLLRTPRNAANVAFPGKSLRITGGNLNLDATGTRTVTINDLRLNGGATVGAYGSSGTQTLAGTITAKNSTDNTIRGYSGLIISANIVGGVGGGGITYVHDGTMLTGNNTGYLGATIIGDGRFSTLKISNETNLGGNPTFYGGAWLQLNRGILQTTATMTIDDANRGVLIGPSGGFFRPDAGTTLTIATPINSPAAGNTLQTAPMDSNPIQGIFFKDGSGVLELTHPNNSHNAEMQILAGELRLTGNGRLNNGNHWFPITLNSLFTDNSAMDQTLAGVISGTGSMVKGNTSTLKLTGSNTFSGTVTVNGGTLYANAGNAANGRALSYATSITVNNGGTLRTSANALFGWDGTQERPITVNTGGTFSANGGLGSDVGVGTVTLAGGTLTTLATGATDYGSFRFDEAADKLLVTQDSVVSAANVKFGNASASIDVNAGKTLNFTGTITNATSGGTSYLTKVGAGTLILAGVNTYTGATALNAGATYVNGTLAAGSTVNINSGAGISGTGTVNGPIGFNNGAKLIWNLTTNSASAGAGTKLNAGAVTVVGGAVVDMIFNAAGSTADFSNAFWSTSHTWNVFGTGSMSGAFSLGSISNDSAGHVIGNYGSFTLQQSAAGVTVLFLPLGQQLPATPTGLTASAAPGKVTLTWSSAAAAATYNVKRATSAGGPYATIATGLVSTSFTDTSGANGTTYYYVVTGVNPNGESAASSSVSATPHAPSTINKANNTTNLNLTGSWTGGIVPNAFDTARWTGLAGANSVLLGSDTSLNGVIVATTGGAVTLGAGNTLTLGTGGFDLSAATQNLTISSNLSLAPGNQPWNVIAGKNLTLNTGTFTRATGSTVTLPNTGTVAASMTGIANDTTGIVAGWLTTGSAGNGDWVALTTGTMGAYASYTTITAATAANAAQNWLTTNNAAGITATGTVNSVKMTADLNIPSGATLTLGSGGLLMSGDQKWVLNNGVGSVAGTGKLNSGLSSGELFVHVAKSTATNWTIWPTIIDGAAAVKLVKNGSGLVFVMNANTFSGGTWLNDGTVVAGNATALGSGAVQFNGATLGTTAALAIANAITVSGTNYIGFAGQGNNSITLSGGISGDGTLKNFVGTGGSSNVFFTGSFSGFTGTIDYTDDGGANAQWWRVGANGSTVDLSNASVILRVGNVSNTVASKNFGFTDNITGATLRLGALSGDGAFQSSFNNVGPNTLEVGYLNTNTTFSGVLSGANAGQNMAFTKVGTGTLTLGGGSAYTGVTSVNGGTLVLNAALTGTSSVAVNNGATLMLNTTHTSPIAVASGGKLGGTGSCSGAVTVATNAIMAPGSGTGGVLTLSNGLSFANGSVINMTLGSAACRIATGGTFSAAGTTTVNVTALTGFGAGPYQIVTGATGISESTFAIGTIPAGYAGSLTASGGTLTLTIAVLPGIPSGLTATGNASGVNLTWSAASNATTYKVKRSTTQGSGYVTIASGVAGTSYSDTGLTVGTTCYYVVSGVNTAGEGPNSNEANATVYTAQEAWRQQYFGNPADTGNGANSADPDGDGMTNAQECVSGTIPTDSNSYLRITAVQRIGQSFQITFPTISGKSYRVEYSEAMNADSWQTLQSGIAGTGNPVQVTDPNMSGASRRYYRAGVAP